MAYYVLNETSLQELNELRSNDGGVIKKDSGTAMNPNARILVIGLGGVGLRTVYELKKTLEGRIGKIPSDSQDIKFLAIDTDKADLTLKCQDGVLSEEETFLLYNEKLTTEINHLRKNQIEHVSPAVSKIYPPYSTGFDPNLRGMGANQIRLAGRLSLLDSDRFGELTRRLRGVVSDLRTFTEKTLEVYVIAGIGGGSGSSLVIDIPYVVRKVLHDVGLSDNRVRMFGYVYLPNIYDNGQVASLDNAYRNGYSALKELDYYMNIGRIHESFDARYPDGDFSSNDPIFTQCTLIGGKSSANVVISDTKSAAVDCCVSALLHQVTSAHTGDDGTGSSSLADIFSSDSFIDNVQSALDVIIQKGNANFHEGGNYHYACVGSSSLKFPTEAITERFVGTAYQKMMEHMKACADRISQKEIDDFAKGVLAPDDVMKKSLNELASRIDQKFENHKWDKGSVNSTAEMEITIKSEIDKILNDFDKNGDLVKQAIATATDKATALFKDTQKGPFYLAALLTSTSVATGKTGYYEKLESYAGIAQKRKIDTDNAAQKERARRRELAQEMQKFGRFNKNLEDFLGIFKREFLLEMESRLSDRLANEYYHALSTHTGACYKLKSNLDDNFLHFVDIINYVSTILAENVKASEKELLEPDSGSILSLGTEPCLRAFKASVDRTAVDLDRKLDDETIQKLVAALTDDVLKNKESWKLADSPIRLSRISNTANAFRDFVKKQEIFAAVMNRTFSDYFEAAYSDETETEKDRIVSFLVDRLCTDAMPMFNVWRDFSWETIRDLRYQYLILPNNMGDYWGGKFNQKLASRGVRSNIFYSPDQSSLSNYTMYAGIPMWLHADLPKYEKEYSFQIKKTPGMHLDGSEAFQPPYAEYPALLPAEQWFHADEGRTEYVNPDEKAIRNDIEALTKFCLDRTVIRFNERGNAFEVLLLKNKPDASDPEAARIVSNYCNDPFNMDEDNLPKAGAPLYDYLLEKLGYNTYTIMSLGAVRPNQEKNLGWLIRHQMHLVKLLRDERDYILSPNSIFGVIDTMITEGRVVAYRKTFFRYMMYGLVSAGDRGAWSYRLGDKQYPIISKLQVSETDASMVAHMEMAACDAFYKLQDLDAHMLLLKQSVSRINASIDSGDLPVSLVLDNCNEYKKLAESKLDAFMIKHNRGETLTTKEMEIQKFYALMQKTCDEIRAVLV